MKTLIRGGCLSLCVIGLFSGCNDGANFTSSSKKAFDAVNQQVYSFKASEISTASVSLKDGGRFQTLAIRQAEKAPSQVIHRQVKRQRFEHVYTQGRPARFTTEEFQLSEAGYLDLLVVVDDSKSMSEEQAILSKGLAPLVSAVKDVNWQIAVISMSNPCVTSTNLIKKGDLNPAQKFAAAVNKPVDTNNTERGFPMAIQALKGQCNGLTRPWIRPGSSVGILFISDEDNCGSSVTDQSRCRNIFGKNATEMVSFLRTIRAPEESRIYSIVDKDGSCPAAAAKGAMYMEASLATGGSSGSICHDYNQTTGYGGYLSRISTDVNRIVKRQFSLSALPDMNRFEVSVDGSPVAANGVVFVNGQTVSIDPAAFKTGLKIAFSYSHDAVPMFNDVAINTMPAPDTLDVRVNGVQQIFERDFTIDATRRVIVFTTMPPAEAKVTVSYLEHIPLIRRFPVNLLGVRPDTMEVTVNLVKADQSTYFYDESAIEFAAAPADGSVIILKWRTDDHKILTYEMQLRDPREPVSWVVRDKLTAEPVVAEWDRRFIRFSPEQVIEGRDVEVQIDFGAKSPQRTLNLPNERIDDDVKVLADGVEGGCSLLPQSTAEDVTGVAWKSRYKGRRIDVECKADLDYSELNVEYRHEIGRTNQFLIKLPGGIDPNEPTLGWKVYVDGVRIDNFQRTGAEFEIEEELLPPEARVDIEMITYTRVEQ